jgi:transcriptional regulator with XRE-family HTH domain
MSDNTVRSATFARKVRELRTGRGWSQAELGRRLSGQPLGQSRIAQIEDNGSVTIDQAQDFADALGVPVEVLLYDKPPGAEDVLIRQRQRLIRIINASQGLTDEVVRLSDEISAELPGKLPPGTIVTATDVIRPADG